MGPSCSLWFASPSIRFSSGYQNRNLRSAIWVQWSIRAAQISTRSCLIRIIGDGDSQAACPYASAVPPEAISERSSLPRIGFLSKKVRMHTITLLPIRESTFFSSLLVDWRHFCVRAIHQVEIPRAVDGDEKEISVRSNPTLVNHFARHVIVATRT